MNTRCSGRVVRDDVAFGFGNRFLFAIEHPEHENNFLVNVMPSCLAVSTREGHGRAHTTRGSR